MRREQFLPISRDLKKKMVFLSGPRQVGKTWIAKELMKNYNRPRYLNWDNSYDREIIKNEGWSVKTDLLVLDEIHKMPQWKNYLKGVWDTKPPEMHILVSGSARLDTFRQSGDSLAGRYYHHRLLPVTPTEAARVGKKYPLEHFLSRGGFPEPFLAESEDEAGRWRKQYMDGLIREDILSFENVTQLRAMNLLLELLRERVSSLISFQGLAEDLGVAPNTVKKYIEILEALYIVFRVTPYHRAVSRSLVKQPKLYFFDTGMVKGGIDARLENCVSLSLYKELLLKEDKTGKNYSLHFLRTRNGHEVDFVIAEENKARLMIEVKHADRNIAKGLHYFHKQYGFPGLQTVMDLRAENESSAIPIRRTQDWLETLEFDAQ